MKNFKYLDINNVSTDTANIYLYTGVGEAWDETSAAQIVYELDYILKYLPEVKKIKAHINSPGGGVVQGFGIFSKMMDINNNEKGITLDTYNDGVAASTAGWLLLAGKTIYMQDYALIMMHNLSMGEKAFLTPKETEILQKFKDSIITIFASRTGLERDAISKMMDKETWLDSSQALEMKFVDKIITSGYGKTTVPAEATTSNIYNIVNSIREREQTSQQAMEQATSIPQKPNFMQNAITETIITEPSNQPPNTMAENTVIFPLELQKILSVNNTTDAVTAISEMQNKTKALELHNASLETRAKTAEDLLQVSNMEKANSLIQNAINDRRIVAADKATWVELAMQNYNLAEKTLTSIAPAKILTRELEKAENGKPSSDEDRSNWTQVDWAKNDATGLKEMRANDPEAYAALANIKKIKK